MRQRVARLLLPVASQSRSALGARIRSRAYGTRCLIDTGVTITNARRFVSGPSCALYHGTYVLNDEGEFTLGDGSHLGAYCYVNAAFGSVEIGDHVAIGPGTKIFAYSNGYETGRWVTDTKVQANVRIGRNVFIGANVVVLPGAVIEDDVVVGAGSVVRGVLAAGGVYVGSPARRIKSFDGRGRE
ncbi:MAG TPA: DapH/DapD/GlmU-related protein [Mycobacteriales bacterium]|nr:DapH/DapD/GlmU-related protein [Mycobacteriales bacterium]